MQRRIEHAFVCALTIAGCAFAQQNRFSPTEIADYFSSSQGIEASLVPIMPVIPDCPKIHRLYFPIIGNSGGVKNAWQKQDVSSNPQEITETQIITSEVILSVPTSEFPHPFPDPAGLDVVTINGKTYLVVTDSEVNETDLFAGKNVAFVDATNGEVISTTTTTAFSNEPTDVAIDDKERLLFSDDDRRRINTAEPSVSGEPLKLKGFFSTQQFGSGDPEGISSHNKTLYIADGAGKALFIVIDGGDGEVEGPCFPGDDRVLTFSTADFGRDFEGVYATTHPENLNETRLYMVDRRNPSQISVVRVNEEQTVATPELIIKLPDELQGTLLNLSGIALLPNGDIAIVDRGVDNDVDPAENDGWLFIIRLGQQNIQEQGDS